MTEDEMVGWHHRLDGHDDRDLSVREGDGYLNREQEETEGPRPRDSTGRE